MKKLTGFIVLLIAVLSMAFAAQAASYSSAWYQNGDKWYIRWPNGSNVTNCWVCDNGAGPNCSNNWYLIDSNGAMVSAPLVQDGTGNYYSLETNHNGNYGMLRYTNGTYDGIPIQFNQSHNGSFGAITNQDAINALKAKYGVYNVSHINNSNCYYTSAYNNRNTSSGTHTINYYVNGSKWKSTSSTDSSIYIQNYGSSLRYWQDSSTGDIYYPGDYYYFGNAGDRTVRLNAVLKNTTTTTTTYIYNYTEPAASTTYEVVFIKDGSIYKTMTSSGNTFTVPSCSASSSGSFLYWGDEYGREWQPGQTYTARTTYDTLEAVFNSYDEDDYWSEDGGYDIW